MAQRGIFADLPCSAKTHAGIARRAGRSPSAARKLPKQKPRSPRGMTETGKPKRGASGGMQGGPRRGRSPITGPALPSPEAAQTTDKEKPPCPQDTTSTSQRTSLLLTRPEYWPRKLYRNNELFLNNQPPFLKFPTAPRRPPNLSCSAKTHAGIARRAGRSPTKGGKLPKQMPRSPHEVAEYEKPCTATPWE